MRLITPPHLAIFQQLTIGTPFFTLSNNSRQIDSLRFTFMQGAPIRCHLSCMLAGEIIRETFVRGKPPRTSARPFVGSPCQECSEIFVPSRSWMSELHCIWLMCLVMKMLQKEVDFAPFTEIYVLSFFPGSKPAEACLQNPPIHPCHRNSA